MNTPSDFGLHARHLGMYSHVLAKPRGGSLSIRWDVENTHSKNTYSVALLLEVPIGLIVQTAGPITVGPHVTGAIAFVYLVSGALLPGNILCLLTMRGWLPATPSEFKDVAAHSFTLQVS